MSQKIKPSRDTSNTHTDHFSHTQFPNEQNSGFSKRRQCNLKISLEKNLKTCKEKFQCEMRRGKKKTKWLLSESLLYQSGDPVAVKMPETVTPEGRKIDRAGPFPFLPGEIKFRILSEKLKENREDRRGGEAGALHLRNSSRVELPFTSEQQIICGKTSVST